MLSMDRETTLFFLLRAYWENLTVYRGKVLNHEKNWHTLVKDKIIEENNNLGILYCCCVNLGIKCLYKSKG